MQYGKSKKITEEVYNRAVNNHGYITKEDAETVFTDAERLGYGVYGTYVYKLAGEFYVGYALGDSCD